MISTLKRLTGHRKSDRKRIKPPEPENDPVRIPENFICPISLDLMKDPVILSSGITYDRPGIESWLQSGNYTCPVTGSVLLTLDLIPNHSLLKMIQEWCVSSGIDRVPTPRAPLLPSDVVLLLSQFTSAASLGHQPRCLELLRTLRRLGSESHLNSRRIIEHGAGSALVAAFIAFSDDPENDTVLFLEEVLSALSGTLPWDHKACRLLAAAICSPSATSLRRGVVWFLNQESSKRDAIVCLKETIINSSSEELSSLVEAEGFVDALIRLFRDPIGSSAKRACLEAVYRLVSEGETRAAMLEGTALVYSVVEELIGEPSREVCEAALGVLDAAFVWEEGREEGWRVSALVVPVLAKKMLRVSAVASELSVSALWRLCKEKRDEGDVILMQALEVGAFQKILVLLQMGCGEETKEKASEVLKMLNGRRDRGVECIESLDFKHLKRSFD